MTSTKLSVNRRPVIGVFLGFAALMVFGVVGPLFLYPTFLMKIWCFALFACAFNLLLGYGGLLSFGHAAFFGGAAYICGHVVKVWGWPPELGLVAGMASAAGLGFIIGSLAIRRAGIYFAMITLALAQMVYFLCLQMNFTGGENGMQGIPRGVLFGFISLSDNLTMYYVVFAIFFLSLLAIYRTVNSPFGQILKAIRENEPRAISLGFDVGYYKLSAFVMSAALAGLAGSAKALTFQLASLADAHWHMSGEVVLMTLLGGVGTIFGPVIGAGVIVALQNELADKVGPWVSVIIGVFFVICVLLFRRGIVGEITAAIGGRNARPAAPREH
jgi:branched-chain amino acid transport system permease protein